MNGYKKYAVAVAGCLVTAGLAWLFIPHWEPVTVFHQASPALTTTKKIAVDHDSLPLDSGRGLRQRLWLPNIPLHQLQFYVLPEQDKIAAADITFFQDNQGIPSEQLSYEAAAVAPLSPTISTLTVSATALPRSQWVWVNITNRASAPNRLRILRQIDSLVYPGGKLVNDEGKTKPGVIAFNLLTYERRLLPSQPGIPLAAALLAAWCALLYPRSRTIDVVASSANNNDK